MINSISKNGLYLERSACASGRRRNMWVLGKYFVDKCEPHIIFTSWGASEPAALEEGSVVRAEDTVTGLQFEPVAMRKDTFAHPD